MDWVKLATQSITGLIQYNSPDRRRERKKKKIKKQLAEIESKLTQAWIDRDADTATYLRSELNRLLEQASRDSQ